jgi:hypothetical protein
VRIARAARRRGPDNLGLDQEPYIESDSAPQDGGGQTIDKDAQDEA